MLFVCFFCFFIDTATTDIYTYGHTLSLRDALPISNAVGANTVAVGHGSTSDGDGSVAVGGMGQAYDEYNSPIYDDNGDPVLIGAQAVAGSTAIGAGTQATGEGSTAIRSEERRVGKEWVRKCRSRGSPDKLKRKNNQIQ